MNLSQKETGKRFECFQEKAGIADIIESRSLLSMIKAEGNERLPISHEKILFASIKPETKVLSAFGHFEPLLSEDYIKIKEKTQLQKIMGM